MMFSPSLSAISQISSHRSSAWRSFKSRRSRVRRPDSWFSDFFYILSLQDLVLVCAALLGLYLITGENAELVCDTFTSLPAAVYTYQLLTNPKSTTVAYEAALCFWILYGTLVVFDHLLRRTVWYFLTKFLLMSAVSSHVMAKCRSRNEKTGGEAENIDQPAAVKDTLMSLLSSLSVMPESTSETVVGKQLPLKKRILPRVNHTLGRVDGNTLATPKRRRKLPAVDSPLNYLLYEPKNELEEFVPPCMRTQCTPRSPYFRSLSDKFTLPQKRLEQIASDDVPVQQELVSRAVQTMSVMETLMTGQSMGGKNVPTSDTLKLPDPVLVSDGDGEAKKVTASATESQSSFFTNRTNRSTFASITTTNDDAVRKVTYNEIRCHLARNGSLAGGDIASRCTFSTTRKTVDFLEDSFNYSSSRCKLLTLEREDLIVNVKKLIFRRPYHRKVLIVVLANNSANRNIMWEIKTNAAARVFITPNCGVLLVKTMVKLCINVCCDDDSETPHSELPFITRDRIAIDYVFVAAECAVFNVNLFVERGTNRMRKNLNITYK